MKTNQLVLGILAHVDAGKTTLAESILYQSGVIRKLGRVDHKDAFLDTYELEKLRGITIFSKQAEFTLGERTVTLLDTPGHVDFSAEMERALQVLDYAILVINGMDGVQGHSLTLWKLLKRYGIPVFLFINKMDQAGTDRKRLVKELQDRLGDGCLEFSACPGESFYEELAMCDEGVMERYLESGEIEEQEIAALIAGRKVLPCYFGSALKMEGVEEFLEGLDRYTVSREYPEEFCARVYKIGRDAQGARLTYLKIIGGNLKVKMPLKGETRGGEAWEEKVDQIRIYSGSQYRAVSEAPAGCICAVTGLAGTWAGEGLGQELSAGQPFLEPVLSYGLALPADGDVHAIYRQLSQLEEEDPQLHILWEERTGEISVQVMGKMQIEILKSLIAERFGWAVEFGAGRIVYKETIRETVEGVGHFEPLRHYAEVHVVLEPGEPGSGITCESTCSEDVLDRNWQRLVLTHLQERKHPGVLTGSEITDLKLTLTAGRAHEKHTEGGDFRQAAYRAVRQGLRKAESVLLEPVYGFRLEIPVDKVGRAMADIQRLYGTFEPPEIMGEQAVITGSAPISEMRDYPAEVAAYTRGEGRISYALKGYGPCHNAEEVIASMAYDPDQDMENPCGSVFCSHGAGFVVEWGRVEEYMHVESSLKAGKIPKTEAVTEEQDRPSSGSSGAGLDQELEAIFIRTYGAIDRKRPFTEPPRTVKPAAEIMRPPKRRDPGKEYLLVDGYNIIFAWEELRELAKADISAARDQLCDLLCNYQGYKDNTVIVVFDAYKVDGGTGEVQKYRNIHLVYTKQAETADQYIEKTVQEMNKKYQVTVATSDALEQMIIWGMGAMRLSARDLKEELDLVRRELRAEHLEKQEKMRNYLLEGQILPELPQE